MIGDRSLNGTSNEGRPRLKTQMTSTTMRGKPSEKSNRQNLGSSDLTGRYDLE